MSKKLTQAQIIALEELSERPYPGSNNILRPGTIKALEKMGYITRRYFDLAHEYRWVITESGMNQVHSNKEQVAINYAKFDLKYGTQIRHNVKRVRFFPHISIGNSYFMRTFEQEIDAVHNYQMRAIELTRAEIAAMKAG